MGTGIEQQQQQQQQQTSTDEERGHPYGVEPLGNVFLARSAKTRNCRPRGLGNLAVLDDVRMVELMGCLDTPSLCRLAVVSRALYVFSHMDDLWKGLLLQEMGRRPGQTVKTRGCWKNTLAHLLAPDPRDALKTHVPLKIPGFFSDLLFQPHHCATAPIRPEWLERSSVDRRTGLSPADFRELYEEPNLPVVLTDAAESWPALARWTRDKLASEHGDLGVHAGGLEFALKDYLRYAEENRDELPLYVFDKRFVEKCPKLGEEYEVPKVFPDDLFSVLGPDHRPDHRWLIAGPARSGSSFHVDPNCTSAWNATVSGRKKWIMFPPGETPPGVHPSEDGLDLAAPVSIMEWFLNFYEECYSPERKVRPLECVVSPGEVVFVPMGWWHCVLNLEWSVAITQNFVSRVNLPYVVRFLLTQKHLISGLPPEDRDDLGDRFVSALTAQRPELEAAKIAAASIPRRKKAKTRPDGGRDDDNDDTGDDDEHTSKKSRLWEKLKAGGAGGAAVAWSSDATAAVEAPDGLAGNADDECAGSRAQQQPGGFSFGFVFA